MFLWQAERKALLNVLYRASLDSELVVLIYPECMQDIDLLSHVLEPLRQGFDLSVGSWPCRVSCEQETVMLLNGKNTFKEKIGFLADNCRFTAENKFRQRAFIFKILALCSKDQRT